MTNAQDRPILEVLRSYGIEAKQVNGSWVALCPWHDDTRPSLSISTSKNCFYCFGCKVGGGVVQFIAKMENKTPKQVLGIGRPARSDLEKIVAEYTYTDPQSNPLYQVVRFEPKDFRQRKWNAETKRWQWNMDNVRRVPYNLKDIYARPKSQIWIVEGERDCETLREIGLVGTTNSGGAGKWNDDHSSWLSNRDVVLCGDNDKAGREHMNGVFESVYTYAKSIARCEVPSKYKDVTEWREAFSSPGDFAAALGGNLQASEPGLWFVKPSSDSTEAQVKEFEEMIAAAKAVLPVTPKGRRCVYDILWTIIHARKVK